MGLGEEERARPTIGDQWGAGSGVVERVSAASALLRERQCRSPGGDVQGREVTVRRF